MIFNKHSELEGQHAFLSASQYHWLNYDLDKLTEVYKNHLAVLKGTELHEFASKAINLGIRLKATKQTLNMFVNHAIDYGMNSEQVLYYSINCFGTADAISFRNNILRIHDLKTGKTPASMNQLMIYAALFCLEYEVDPNDIKMELRIYQSDVVKVYEPTGEEIIHITGIIKEFDKRINAIKLEEL